VVVPEYSKAATAAPQIFSDDRSGKMRQRKIRFQTAFTKTLFFSVLYILPLWVNAGQRHTNLNTEIQDSGF